MDSRVTHTYIGAHNEHTFFCSLLLPLLCVFQRVCVVGLIWGTQKLEISSGRQKVCKPSDEWTQMERKSRCQRQFVCLLVTDSVTVVTRNKIITSPPSNDVVAHRRGGNRSPRRPVWCWQSLHTHTHTHTYIPDMHQETHNCDSRIMRGMGWKRRERERERERFWIMTLLIVKTFSTAFVPSTN